MTDWVPVFQSANVVIIHQAIAVAASMETGHNLVQNTVQCLAVLVVDKDHFACITPAGDMLGGPGEFYSVRSCQGFDNRDGLP